MEGLVTFGWCLLEVFLGRLRPHPRRRKALVHMREQCTLKTSEDKVGVREYASMLTCTLRHIGRTCEGKLMDRVVWTSVWCVPTSTHPVFIVEVLLH